jgi:hypothetical protein
MWIGYICLVNKGVFHGVGEESIWGFQREEL